jgi:single-strand DNA-binding protein
MNTINLIGRTTADPELRFTASGTPVCSFRLAVNNPPRDGKEQPAMFVDVVSFGAQAEAIAEHVGKGRQVAVSGRLSYRQWDAEDGSKRSRHEVVAHQVEFLARPAGNGSEAAPAYAAGEEPY